MALFTRSVVNRTIGPRLWAHWIMTVLVIVTIVWLVQLLRMSDSMVGRGIGLGIILELSVLTLPMVIAFFLPVTVVVAVLLTYHHLQEHHEIVALQALGWSPWRLSWPSFQLSAAVMILASVLSLYWIPLSYHRFKEQQTLLRDRYAAFLLQPETLITPVPGITFYLQSKTSDGELRGIMLHDERRPGNEIIMTAESARIEIRPHAVVFIMQNGVRQERQQKKEAMHVLSFKRYPVDISLYASGLANREKQPEERFLQELWLPEATVSDLLRARLLPEFWQRLFWPCYSLVLPMMMALWLLHRPHRRVGYWSWDLWVWMAVLWAVYGAALLLPSLSLRMPQIRFLIPIFPLVIILSGILAWRPPRIPGWSRKWAKQ